MDVPSVKHMHPPRIQHHLVYRVESEEREHSRRHSMEKKILGIIRTGDKGSGEEREGKREKGEERELTRQRLAHPARAEY